MSGWFAVMMGPALAVAASVALGRLLLRAARVELHRCEEWVLGFVAGAAGLSAIIAAMAAAHQGRKGAFTGVAALLVALALWRARKPAEKRLPPLPRRWVVLLAAVCAVFGWLYAACVLAPEIAGGERLGLVFREWHTRRLLAPPDGMRMLFLWAFSFGRHSAAAAMHLCFLAALAAMALCYGRRHGSPGAGVFAAAAVFTAPIAGAAGAAALDDAAVACAVFAAFYLLETPRGWIVCALPAAFGLSLRHTLPDALLFRSPRELALWGTETGGLLGPVFLLAPVGLLALRHPRGGKLLAAGAALALAGAADARWMIPALPFLALAMGMAMERTRGALPVLALAAAVFSWPPVTELYADRNAWRIPGPPPAEPAGDYLHRRVRGYVEALVVEEAVPEGGRVFVCAPVAHAYTRREVVTDAGLRDALLTPLRPALQPSESLRFAFAARPVRRLRVTHAGAGAFTAAEFRILRGGSEVARQASWRIRAVPDARAGAAAFDNSAVTRWTGSALEAVLPAAVEADAVVLECPPGQPVGALRLEVDGAGSQAPAVERARPAHLRQAAVHELRLRGIEYLLITAAGEAASDIRENTAVWGLAPVKEMYDARVYRVE